MDDSWEFPLWILCTWVETQKIQQNLFSSLLPGYPVQCFVWRHFHGINWYLNEIVGNRSNTWRYIQQLPTHDWLLDLAVSPRYVSLQNRVTFKPYFRFTSQIWRNKRRILIRIIDCNKLRRLLRTYCIYKELFLQKLECGVSQSKLDFIIFFLQTG